MARDNDDCDIIEFDQTMTDERAADPPSFPGGKFLSRIKRITFRESNSDDPDDEVEWVIVDKIDRIAEEEEKGDGMWSFLEKLSLIR